MSDDEKQTSPSIDAVDANQDQQAAPMVEDAYSEKDEAEDEGQPGTDEADGAACDDAGDPNGHAADTEDVAEGDDSGDVTAPESTEPAAESPAKAEGIPVLEDVAATVSDTEGIPRTLTRDEYLQVGDDPDPLPAGFEVIDGGAGDDETIETVTMTEESDNPSEAAPPHVPAANADSAMTETDAATGSGNAIASAAANVGAMLSQGVGAVREVGAAKRAHAEARDQLDELSRVIGENEDEYNHRRDVEQNYDRLYAEQTARRDEALATANTANLRQSEVENAIAQLKEALAAMKDEDSAQVARLKTALEAAESREASAREGANRIVRRLTDAQAHLETTKKERETSIAAAKAAVETAQARLSSLREEFAEIQRNPSANTAAYSVRGGELEANISDAAEQLRRAQEDLPRITADVEQAVRDAQAAVDEANKPIDEARSSFRTVADATSAARDALEEARKQAEARQKAQREAISKQEKLRQEQRAIIENAQAEAQDAQAILDDAADIKAHPEITEQLGRRIAQDRAIRADQLQRVESLAEAEKTVRERTRTSRMRLTGVVIAAVIVLVVIVWCWMTFM